MYGICGLSIVPLRAEPKDQAELTSQLLFGELYLIIETREKWYKVKTAYEGYEGWIDKIQHTAVDKEYFNDYLDEEHPILNTFTELATVGNNFFPILLGSILPFHKDGKIWLGNRQVEVNYSEKNTRNLIDTAFLYYNAPYLWGGKTPFGIDCSGLVQQTFKLQGIRLPRDAYQQVEEGEEVSIVDSKPGDLAFFENDKKKIHHVGIVIPQNQIIHAHGRVRSDKLDDKGIWNNDRDEYSHKLKVIKRIV